MKQVIGGVRVHGAGDIQDFLVDAGQARLNNVGGSAVQHTK